MWDQQSRMLAHRPGRKQSSELLWIWSGPSGSLDNPHPNPTSRVGEQGMSAGGRGPAGALGRPRAPTSSLPRTRRASGTAAKRFQVTARVPLSAHRQATDEELPLQARPNPAALSAHMT